ncbi:MAG: hypothetical protein KAG53_05280 [Endozoicomonadaceae bacterium]|nr:hypothetical protein [Endozoicomonadaceae bacterium]
MIKGYILTMCILFFPHAAYSSNYEGYFTYLAPGTHSCGKFIGAVNKGNNNKQWAEWNGYLKYTLGYFTGVNKYQSGTMNITGKTDNEGIMAFIEKYCHENPLKDYFDAIQAVESELYPKRTR